MNGYGVIVKETQHPKTEVRRQTESKNLIVFKNK
jgi:hypothetical protein